MGFPTLNIESDAAVEHGVYAVFAVLKGRKYPGVMNYGPRPTFNETDAFLKCFYSIFQMKFMGRLLRLSLLKNFVMFNALKLRKI